MIQLPVRSATQFLGNLIAASAGRFPELLPHVAAFQKKKIGDDDIRRGIVRFEAERAALPHRVDVAQFLIDSTYQQLVFEAEGQTPQPLHSYMEQKAEPLHLNSQRLGHAGGLIPEVIYKGEKLRGAGLLNLVEEFQKRRTLTDAAVEALKWTVDQGTIDLTGKKFVLLGANAELAPTEILLRAGATVLWIDLISPEKFLGSVSSGTLVFPSSPVNVLEQPREIAATIEKFSDGEPVHIGAFAYKGGKALETRLAAAMNAIIRRLHHDQIASISCFVSPTSPAPVESEDETSSYEKFNKLSFLPNTLNRLGYFKANHMTLDHQTYWADAIVPLQGASYLISQYIEKILAAEVWATRGTHPQEVRRPVLVSANTAGITRTKNMQIPVFQLGFAGAPSLGLETYAPETTRWLNGLLMLHDLLNPESPGHPNNSIKDEAEKAARLRREQIHGGIYSFPFALQETITLAGAKGIFKEPGILWKALRKKKSS